MPSARKPSHVPFIVSVICVIESTTLCRLVPLYFAALLVPGHWLLRSDCGKRGRLCDTRSSVVPPWEQRHDLARSRTSSSESDQSEVRPPKLCCSVLIIPTPLCLAAALAVTPAVVFTPALAEALVAVALRFLCPFAFPSPCPCGAWGELGKGWWTCEWHWVESRCRHGRRGGVYSCAQV